LTARGAWDSLSDNPEVDEAFGSMTVESECIC
jgi:hypothetical protein